MDSSKTRKTSDRDISKSSKKVRIDDDKLTPPSTDRSEPRRSTFTNTTPMSSSTALLALEKSNQTITAERTSSYIENLANEIPGLVKINLTTLTQKIIGCTIGENVTTEYPWIYIKKEIIEDNLDLHDESSDFLPIKKEIYSFPEKEILMGYAPTTVEGGQFYVCLTEDCTNAVLRHIENLRIEQGNRVRKSVYKTPGKWQDLGSAEEVDNTIIKNNRPLIEVEIASTSKLFNRKMVLSDRAVEDVRDGYICVVPSDRETFDVKYKTRLDAAVNAASPVRAIGSQTTRTMEVNSWSQYSYECPSMDAFWKDPESVDRLKKFLDEHSPEMIKQVQINGIWDIYKDDISELASDDAMPPSIVSYIEKQSYYEGNLCRDRVINDLSWHPLWTGVAAVAYTNISKCDNHFGPKHYDEVQRACEGTNYILIWSFDDCLSPKLILESPREVTAVSICPFDGNIVIGGCANGQIGIWDIPGAIQKIEKVVIHTSAEVKYKIAMKTLMSWMRDSRGDQYFRPAAMSSLQSSHKGQITKIYWVPPYNKVDKNGRIQSLPADASPDELVWQFITSSEDGTIGFWDLKWRPQETTKQSQQAQNKDKQKLKALSDLISEYKVLDGIFAPNYMLIVQDEHLVRSSISCISMCRARIDKELISEITPEDDIFNRKYFKMHIQKPDDEMKSQIFVGTLKGECGVITWDGYEFSTGVAVNKENVRWVWKENLHDGPVCTIARSTFLPDVIATIGGKIYALWREDFPKPIFWRESSYRYTACCWSLARPTVLVLARNDGSVEIWDYIVRSDMPNIVQSVSGRIITGIYVHDLPMYPHCICFCDFNGTLRLFVLPEELLHSEGEDLKWMRNFIDREVGTIIEFNEWTVQWIEMNKQYIEDKKKYAKIATKKKLADAKRIAEMTDSVPKIDQEPKGKKLPPLKEDLWIEAEVKRMQRVLLETKNLKEDELERKRAPVVKLRQEARLKRKKFRDLVKQQDQLLEEQVAHLFPEQNFDKPEPPIISMQSLNVVSQLGNLGESFIKDGGKSSGDHVNSDDEIINNFEEIQSEAFEFMANEPFKRVFDWRKMMTEGKARRQSMDIALKQCNKPRYRASKKTEPRESVDFLLRPTSFRNYESNLRIVND